MLRGSRSFRAASSVRGGVPAAKSGCGCGLLANALDKADGPARGRDEVSLREGSSACPSEGTGLELEGCGRADGVGDCPGTGDDSLMFEACLLCDRDIDLEIEVPPIELVSSLDLPMSNGREDMIGLPRLG